jgi:hypothetical protein
VGTAWAIHPFLHSHHHADMHHKPFLLTTNFLQPKLFREQAEMYPTPSSDPCWVPGTTERFIGTWIAKNPTLRKDVVIVRFCSLFFGCPHAYQYLYYPKKAAATTRVADLF